MLNDPTKHVMKADRKISRRSIEQCQIKTLNRVILQTDPNILHLTMQGPVVQKPISLTLG
jgi:hypothetical protein